MQVLVAWLTSRCRDETGAALVEYALILLLVVVAAIVSLVYLGGTAPVPINNVAGHLGNAA